MNVYERIKEIGEVIPKAPAKGGVYSPVKTFGKNLVYVSGCGPAIGNENYLGKLGKDLSIEDGKKASKNCILNVLAVLHNNIEDLNRIKNIAKILTFVSCDSEFYEQPQVANGGSQLLVDIFGPEIGAPSRSAIGVNSLPGNIAVEIEMLVELKE